MPPLPGNIPADTPIPGQLGGLLLRRLANRLPHELEDCRLTLIGGDTVRLTTAAEVLDWLQGWAVRLEAGEQP